MHGTYDGYRLESYTVRGRNPRNWDDSVYKLENDFYRLHGEKPYLSIRDARSRCEQNIKDTFIDNVDEAIFAPYKA